MAYFHASQLITAVRTRLNMEDDDQFVTDVEILSYLNDEWDELWHLVVETNAEFLSVEVVAGAVPSGSDGPALGDGVLQLERVPAQDLSYVYTVWRHLSLELETTDGKLQPLEKIMWNERVRFGYGDPGVTGRPRYYSIFHNRIYVHPKPDQAYGYRWTFIPVATRMETGDGAPGFGYNCYMGWQNFIINGACATICAKEERDPGYFMSQKETWRQNIKTQASPRDAGQPERAFLGVGRDDLDDYLEAQ